jgi:general secretion pathway protein J
MRAAARRPKAREDGFTLLEVLVALVVLGFLMAGLAGGIRLGMQAWNAQDRAIAVHGELDAMDRALRRLIEQADPGDQTHAAGVAGDASRLALTTRLPAASDRAVEAVLLVDARHRLVLRWMPRRFGRPIGPPPPPHDTELLDGVASVQFAFWPRGAQGGWRGVWDGPDPPALVRIRLSFSDAARHWPDIVAAPERDRPH